MWAARFWGLAERADDKNTQFTHGYAVFPLAAAGVFWYKDNMLSR